MAFQEIATDCWLTPEDPVLDRLHMLWSRGDDDGPCIDLDPFSDPHSLVVAARTIDARRGGDGYDLEQWGQLERARVMVNGPYSGDHPARNAEVCAQAFKSEPTVSIANLCPFAAGSSYWANYVWPFAAAVVCLGRLAFVAGRDLVDDKGRITARQGERVAGNRHEIALVLMTRDHAEVRALRSIFADYPVVGLL